MFLLFTYLFDVWHFNLYFVDPNPQNNLQILTFHSIIKLIDILKRK